MKGAGGLQAPHHYPQKRGETGHKNNEEGTRPSFENQQRVLWRNNVHQEDRDRFEVSSNGKDYTALSEPLPGRIMRCFERTGASAVYCASSFLSVNEAHMITPLDGNQAAWHAEALPARTPTRVRYVQVRSHADTEAEVWWLWAGFTLVWIWVLLLCAAAAGSAKSDAATV
jgi:hypothetical protein